MQTNKFGRYEVKEKIGSGGMSTVYHAYDPEQQKDVAIKVLLLDFLNDPTLKARFKREAQAISMLKHPGIVPVFDFGEENEQPYMVLRYMAGGSLEDKMNKGALSLEEIVKIFSKLAPALDDMHSQGIIHRDLKPGNILLDKEGNPAFADFGICKLKDAATALTGESMIGTPYYMSPEQVSGDKNIAASTDIYSLGVILFEMLTGKKPFKANTPLQIAMMHIQAETPSINREEHPELPKELDSLIKRMLSKNPKKRYESAAEIVSELEKILAQFKKKSNQTLTMKKTSSPEIQIENKSIRKTSKKKNNVLLVGSLILLIVISLASIYFSTFSKNTIFAMTEISPSLTPTIDTAIQFLTVGKKPDTEQTTDTTEINSVKLKHQENTPFSTTSLLIDNKKGIIRNEFGMTFVKIIANKFLMGSPIDEQDRNNDELQHEVTLTKNFFMQTTEVTQAEWILVLGNNPSFFQNCGPSCPVENVSWFDVNLFIEKLNDKNKNENFKYRLPTEAEWEFAYRAGSNTPYYLLKNNNNDNNLTILNEIAWFSGNSCSNFPGSYDCSTWKEKMKKCNNCGPHKVILKKSNVWGLYDMAGNVWEWCQDFYGKYPEKNITNPTGLISGKNKVIRGGSWFNSPKNCRAAARLKKKPNFHSFITGFRLVLEKMDRKYNEPVTSIKTETPYPAATTK